MPTWGTGRLRLGQPFFASNGSSPFLGTIRLLRGFAWTGKNAIQARAIASLSEPPSIMPKSLPGEDLLSSRKKQNKQRLKKLLGKTGTAVAIKFPVPGPGAHTGKDAPALGRHRSATSAAEEFRLPREAKEQRPF